MNTDHKDKVKRWKIAIQHFNFDVLHIEGKQNIEADALSRLVPFPTKQETSPTMNNLEQTNMTIFFVTIWMNSRVFNFGEIDKRFY